MFSTQTRSVNGGNIYTWKRGNEICVRVYIAHGAPAYTGQGQLTARFGERHVCWPTFNQAGEPVWVQRQLSKDEQSTLDWHRKAKATQGDPP